MVLSAENHLEFIICSVHPVSQSCVTRKEKLWWATGLSDKWLAATKPQDFGFCIRTTELWPMEQSSILSSGVQEYSLLATAHD